MKARNLLIAANAVLAVGLLAQAAVKSSDSPRRYAIAAWNDRPNSAEETTDLAENVVTVRVKRIRKAEPLTVPISGEPGGYDRVPMEVVELEVIDDDLKGRKKSRETIQLFHTGDSSAVPPGKRRSPPMSEAPPRPEEGAVKRPTGKPGGEYEHHGVLFSALIGDPEYKVGEEYLLFIRKGPKVKVEGESVATSAVVSPEGRWKINRTKKLEPMSDRAWTKELDGQRASVLRDKAVKRARGEEPR
jgi:hypothetical protein